MGSGLFELEFSSYPSPAGDPALRSPEARHECPSRELQLGQRSQRPHTIPWLERDGMMPFIDVYAPVQEQVKPPPFLRRIRQRGFGESRTETNGQVCVREKKGGLGLGF